MKKSFLLKILIMANTYCNEDMITITKHSETIDVLVLGSKGQQSASEEEMRGKANQLP